MRFRETLREMGSGLRESMDSSMAIYGFFGGLLMIAGGLAGVRAGFTFDLRTGRLSESRTFGYVFAFVGLVVLGYSLRIILDAWRRRKGGSVRE